MVKKKTRVADDLDKDLLLFDDEAAWEDVKSPVSQPLSQQPSSEPASAVAAAALSTPFGFGAYSRGAPPVGDQPNPKARRALMEADFGLNVKEEMEEWKQNKCPWLEDVRDAEKRRPSDEGYDKSTLFISKEQLAKLTLPQRQYWDVKSRYFDWIVWFQVGSFYELYAEDAMLGQSLLGLKIHSKGSAGVPAVRIDEWVERFVSHGHKVVVVTQSDEMEGQNKKRIVTEIVSAGTVLEPNDAATGSIFIMSVSAGRPASAGGSRTFAVTFCDLSLLESHVARFDDDKDLSMLLNVSAMFCCFFSCFFFSNYIRCLKLWVQKSSSFVPLLSVRGIGSASRECCQTLFLAQSMPSRGGWRIRRVSTSATASARLEPPK